MKISLPDGLKNERVQTNVGVAFLISLTLFAFGSLNLYFTNISEFSFLFSQIWSLLPCIGPLPFGGYLSLPAKMQ